MLDPHTPARQWLLGLARECGDSHFDPATGLCLIPRDTLWYAAGLLFDPLPGRRELAHHILRTIVGGDGTHTPATMLALLHGVGPMLDAPMRAHLHEAVAADLVNAAGVQWRDGNVNHPLGAYATLILGGEACGEQWAVELGLRRLKEFQTMTGDRRGRGLRQATMSEYNSLTYTALDIVFLALIGEYAKDERARTLGQWLERRVWIDSALHFHPPSQQFAGPHSRSYQEDSTGGFSSLHAVLYAATGEPMYLEPSLCVRFDHPSTLLQCGLTAITPFHLSPGEAALFHSKPMPLSLRMTTYSEQYHENVAGRGFPFDHEIYPGGWRDLTTYMNEEWALGTASLPYVNGGHSDGFMLRIRRSAQVTSSEGFRSIYTRGVFNGAVVGQPNRCHVTGGQIDASYLYEEARYGIYQHGPAAIVFACPKRAGHKGVRSFRLDLIAGWSAPFDELRIGTRPAGSLPIETGGESRIMFRDGRTYGVIIPLVLRPSADPFPVRLWTANGHLMISLFNCDGPERDLTREELTGWRNGFVVVMSTEQDWRSFEEFCLRAVLLRVDDAAREDRVRRVRCETPDGIMVAEFDPGREMFLSRTWNGVEETIDHLAIEAGIEQLPLLEPLTIYGSEAGCR